MSMKDIATENFQRIREAYEILIDEHKRQIYDIYGMEGLTSGLELGPKLSKLEEIKEELERLRRRKEEEKISAHPVSNIVKLLGRMAMSSEVQSQISKRNTIAIGGNLAVTGNSGGGAATALLRHQISSVASIEFMASAGLRALVGVQTSRAGFGLNPAQVAPLDITMHKSYQIQLVLGVESTIGVGWQRKNEKHSAAGEVKFGTSSFGASAHYTHHFSSKSHGRIAGRIGSTALEFEVGGGRRISDFSTVRMLYTLGIQVLLSSHLNPKFVVKPYYRRREKQKTLEKMEKSSAQVQEARAAAEKAQQLLTNVANRKTNRQLERAGLVVTKALYGNSKAFKRRNEAIKADGELASQVLDVTIPLNFLVNDSGQLKLHEGIKKAGIMGFCDPCPGEPKQLHVEYTWGGDKHEAYWTYTDEFG
ncbi:hypothetical protein ACLOJK_039147 [Asimina triloba]